MGYHLMDAVTAQWADLPGNAHKLLMTMAQHTRDGDEMPRSFLSREQLAAALGYKLLPEPPAADATPEAGRIRSRRRTVLTAVGDALKDLQEAGAIRVLKRGQTGQRAEYTFNFNRAAEADAAYERRFYEGTRARGKNGKNPVQSVGKNPVQSVGENSVQSVGENPVPRTTQDNSTTTARNNLNQSLNPCTRASFKDDDSDRWMTNKQKTDRERQRQSEGLRALPNFNNEAAA